MTELPLFPLNTVLFPGIPISLHIFEPRYKDMINHCTATQQPFGVVLIEEGDEALGPLPQPHTIGCTAQITQLNRLPDGRMNLTAVGLERFKIQTITSENSYLTGHVEMLPFSGETSESLRSARNRLRPLVERYLGILSQVHEELDFDPTRLPNDAMALAYLAASVVHVPAEEKQQLLERLSAMEFVDGLYGVYRREVPLLNAELTYNRREDTGLFYVN